MVQCLNYTLDTQTYSTVVAYTHCKVKALMEIQTKLFHDFFENLASLSTKRYKGT